jgi:hypothetical protein
LAVPLVFTLPFLISVLALAGLLLLGEFPTSTSILRGLAVTGEWLNQDPTCDKIVRGESLMLEGVLGVEEESALNRPMFEVSVSGSILRGLAVIGEWVILCQNPAACEK